MERYVYSTKPETEGHLCHEWAVPIQDTVLWQGRWREGFEGGSGPWKHPRPAGVWASDWTVTALDRVTQFRVHQHSGL